MWWRKWFSAASDQQKPVPKTREIEVVAKCIGCGQCAQGCPLKVKIKVPIKDK